MSPATSRFSVLLLVTWGVAELTRRSPSLRLTPEGEAGWKKDKLQKENYTGERKELLDPAASEYAVAIRLMPGSAAAHNSYGVALAKQGRLDQAMAQFQEAVRLDPAFLPAQGNLKMALELKPH